MHYGENGILKQAEYAGKRYQNKIEEEQEELGKVGEYYIEQQNIREHVEYEIQEIEEEYLIILLKITDARGIEEITLWDGTKIKAKGKKQIGINRKVEKDNKYTIKVKYTGEEQENEYIIEPKSDSSTWISKTENKFLGYYADCRDADGNEGYDGVPDGVIYADLAFDKTSRWGSKSWAANFTINHIEAEDLKEYRIINQSYKGPFGEAPVIARVNQNDDTKEDRFFVMALKDIDNQVSGTEYSWWFDACTKTDTTLISLTSQDFGTGKQNTDRIMEEWNKEPPLYKHNTGTHKDIWEEIGEQYEKGWFVPSDGEWGAFARGFNVNTGNYKSVYQLSADYWSSSFFGKYNGVQQAFRIGFSAAFTGHTQINSSSHVRCSTTF